MTGTSRSAAATGARRPATAELALSDKAYGSRMAGVWLAYGMRMYERSGAVAVAWFVQ